MFDPARPERAGTTFPLAANAIEEFFDDHLAPQNVSGLFSPLRQDKISTPYSNVNVVPVTFWINQNNVGKLAKCLEIGLKPTKCG